MRSSFRDRFQGPTLIDGVEVGYPAKRLIRRPARRSVKTVETANHRGKDILEANHLSRHHDSREANTPTPIGQTLHPLACN